MVQINSSGRVAFIGATGSGKTFLAKYLLCFLNRVVVIDPKHYFKLEGYRRSFRLPFQKEFRIIIRPKPHEDLKLATLLTECWKRKYLTIYVDELSSLADGFPESLAVLESISRMGREREIGLWSAMQRPRWVPRTFLSESETLFVFALRSAEDRDLIAGYGGEVIKNRIPLKYFWYIKPDEIDPHLMKVNPETGEIESFDPEGVYNEMIEGSRIQNG